jgi:hypothetical protein
MTPHGLASFRNNLVDRQTVCLLLIRGEVLDGSRDALLLDSFDDIGSHSASEKRVF